MPLVCTRKGRVRTLGRIHFLLPCCQPSLFCLFVRNAPATEGMWLWGLDIRYTASTTGACQEKGAQTMGRQPEVNEATFTWAEVGLGRV